MSEGSRFEQPPPSFTAESAESREQPGQFLYYRVPQQVEGDSLQPLNELQTTYPDLYEAAAAKYRDREWLREETFPGTDWRWNDVLHLSPVHPAELKQAFHDAGGTTTFPDRWYRIPVSAVESTNAIVFRGSFSDPEQGLQPQDVGSFDSDQLAELASVPHATREYYQEQVAADQKPFWFKHVPHVLYHGTIPLKSCEEITV